MPYHIQTYTARQHKPEFPVTKLYFYNPTKGSMSNQDFQNALPIPFSAENVPLDGEGKFYNRTCEESLHHACCPWKLTVWNEETPYTL